MTLLLASSVDVTLIIGLALAATALLRRRSAALRHAVLAAAIGAAALSPALELLLPPLPVVAWGSAATATSSGVTLTSSAAPADAEELSASVNAPAVPWATLLLGIWAIGALVTLAGLLTGLARLARLTAGCTAVRSGRWREIADDLSGAYALRRPVAILQSTDPSLLVTCGVLRPKIILPAGAASWSDDRRRIVLGHELAHIRRRDGAMQLVGEVLRVVHWFNPLVWISCRRLRQESEYACDDAVLAIGVEATDYATHLLGVARHAVGRHQAWASAPAIAHPSTLERRIAAMLNQTRNRKPLSRAACAAAVVGALVITVPVAAVSMTERAGGPMPVAIGGEDVALGTAAAPAVPPVPQGTVAPIAAPRARNTAAAAPQQAPAAISGVVQDQSGAVTPGVELTFTDTEFGVRYTAMTDRNGRFAFGELQPARYEMVARLPGFATVTNVIRLSAGASVERTVTLPLGSLEETITVGCSATGADARPVPSPVTPRTAAFAPSARRSDTRAGTPLPAAIWTRAARAFIPVLSAQEPPSQPTVRVGGQIKVPRQVTKVNPVCPRTLLPAGGTVVVLSGRIGVDGYMNEVRHVAGDASTAPPPPEFVESALEAVRQWTYTPTLLNNQPVEVDVTMTVWYRRI